MSQHETWRRHIGNLYKMIPHVIAEAVQKGESERQIMEKIDKMLDRINEMRRFIGELD